MESTADAVIVGGGPTGLTAASGLAARGLAAVIVDPAEDRSPGSRAILIHAGTLALLDKAGCAGSIIDEAVRIHSMRVSSRTQRLGEIRFDLLPGPYAFIASIHQARTEDILRRRAQELDVRTVTARAVGLDHDRDGVSIVLDTGETLKARFVIGADGIRSFVREAAGIAFPDTGENTGDSENMVLADILASGPVDRDHLTVFPGENMLVLAPLPGARVRVVANLPDGEGAPEIDTIQHLLDTRGPLPRKSSDRIHAEGLEWASRFRFRHHLADSFRAGRILLAGDAGHIHSPVGGQGMNLGIRDGWYLAATLATAIRAETSGAAEEAERVLDAYAANRRATALGVITATNQLVVLC